MIRYLTGAIIDKSRHQLVVLVNGVGFDVVVTPNLLIQSQIGEHIELHISETVREDAHDLYGFTSIRERDLFETLRKVPGLGPKLAIATLGFFSADELLASISSGDAEKLSLVPGIGKKLAAKVILELRDKVVLPTIDKTILTDADTVEALQSLGYSPAEIAELIPKIPHEFVTSQERVTWVLRHLGE